MSHDVKYWLRDNDQSAEDAYECNSSFSELIYVAQSAAEDYWDNHDGWESSWPQKICVEVNGETGTFIVHMDTEPVFYVSKIT